VLDVQGIDVSYGDFRVLSGLTFTVRAGEIFALLGANGAGKSTTLRTLSGLKHPTRGAIRFEGKPIHGLPPYDVARLGVGHVPEGRRVFPNLTVEENLEVGSVLPAPKRRRAETLANVFALFPQLRDRRRQLAGSLSGGEQQMLAIGRALMLQPKLLMLDEPSHGLAPVVVEQVFERITQIHQQGVTVLVVEQNATMCLSIADRGMVLENGRAALAGSRDELLDNAYVTEAYLGL
jgi:branched-chain amino acid transport system ATP-binding protein